MVNNKENILNCIHSTNDINLILTHRSLYIIQKKFEQNKEQLKAIYNKYGEYLEKKENLLIQQDDLPEIVKQIFSVNKFEISDVASFKEALFKEMEYCKEINTEQYILNEFVDFIKNNRKKYNYIYREKKNNSNFNLDDYANLNINITDDWTKEGQVNLFEDDDEQNEIDLIIKDINNRKLKSAKLKTKLILENKENMNSLKINLDLIKKNNEEVNNEKDKAYENSYSESSARISGRKDLSSRSKELGTNYGNESGKGTHRSNINTKRKDEENNNKDVIPENVDDEEDKESNNKGKEIKKDSKKNKKEENNEEEEEEGDDEEEEEKEEEEEEEDDEEENNEEEDSEKDEKNKGEKNEKKHREKDRKSKEEIKEKEDSKSDKKNIKEFKEKEDSENDKKSEEKKNDLDDIDLVNIEKDSKTGDKDSKDNLLFSSPNKKDITNLEKVFYPTNYNKKPKNIKSIKCIKYYLYVDIIPLIIADFISDQRNLYVVIDHSDDLRNNLTSIFDSEILYKLGEDNFEEVLNEMLNKISEYRKAKYKVEKNIENYEKLSEKMKRKNQDLTYINITLKKLKDFFNWLNTKIFTMQNNIKQLKEFEKQKKEEHERIFGPNFKKFTKEKLKEKKDKLIEDYKQLKKDLEIRKFMIQKKKRMSLLNKSSKINLKPIINSTILNNSNNNISNIEKDNSNSPNLSINSNEISGDDYKNTIVLSEQNLSIKKNPKAKNFNYKSNFDSILTEKKIESNDGEEEEKEGNDEEKEGEEEKEAEEEGKKEESEKKEDNEENNENKNIKNIEDINDYNDFSSNNINNNGLNESNKNEIKDEESEEKQEKEKSKENIENELNEEKNNLEENLDNSLKELNIENKEEVNEIKPNQSQPVKRNKKIKLMLKSNVSKNKVNNTGINTNLISKNTAVTNESEVNENNYNIISTNKLKTNPKTTRNSKNIKKRVNYILKKISKPEKSLTKDELREEAIKDIFNFYSSKKSNNPTSFESIQNNKSNLNINSFCKFCNDFKIPLTKDKILSLFNKSISGDSRVMNLQEFKLCLISMSFEINKAQIDEVNRSINIFIGKVNQKNKDKSRFEKENKKEKEKNKEIINKKLKLIEEYQNKSEEELIEDLFKFMEIDDSDKYKQKMNGGLGIEHKSLNLPKIKIPNNNNHINNKKSEHSKTNALLTFNKVEKENPDKIKKMKIGMRIWVKGMIEKERNETPKNKKIEYESEDSKEEEEEKEEEKKDELPVIESQGIPLFSRNKKKDEKKYLYQKFS